MKQLANKIADSMLYALSGLVYRLNKRFVSRHTRSAIAAGRLSVGKHTYGMPILDEYEGSFANVRIGKYCSIGPEVRIITGGNHRMDWVSTYPFRIKLLGDRSYEDGMPYTNGDVEIGSDVWIGGHVTIMSGVKVGHGAVIAAGSLVTKNIPPFAIYGGMPARLIRNRFDEVTTQKLMETAWWERSDEWVKEHIPDLSSCEIAVFLNLLDEDGQ